MEICGIPLQAFLGQRLLGLVNGSFYAMLSLGLAVIFGLLGIVNFAHGALYMIGAYVAFVALDRFGIITQLDQIFYRKPVLCQLHPHLNFLWQFWDRL